MKKRTDIANTMMMEMCMQDCCMCMTVALISSMCSPSQE